MKANFHPDGDSCNLGAFDTAPKLTINAENLKKTPHTSQTYAIDMIINEFQA